MIKIIILKAQNIYKILVSISFARNWVGLVKIPFHQVCGDIYQSESRNEGFFTFDNQRHLKIISRFFASFV